MLAPPNNAPELAKTFKQNPLFQIVWGVSGIEMATWTELEKHLATPTCEFGILAGCMSSVASSNPLIRGNDDLVVAIEETKLAGARDFRKVQVNHSTIMRNDKVLDYTTTFLSRGYFVSPETRQPIEKVVPPAMRDADAPPAALHQRGVTLQRNATPQESERREGEHNLCENNVNRVETKKNEGRARRDGIDE